MPMTPKQLRAHVNRIVAAAYKDAAAGIPLPMKKAAVAADSREPMHKSASEPLPKPETPDAED